jgi:uncharacterized damage-inducible protein DinB
MDLLDRLLGHDAWTTRHLLERCRELTAAQLQQPFDLGHGSLLETFDHIIGNVEVWTDLMLERPVRSWPKHPTVESLIARQSVAAEALAQLARSVREANRWDAEWVDVLDKPPQRKTYGGAITHVLTHSHSHRGEVLHMLSRLGVQDLIEGDALGWEQRHRHQ